MFDIIIRNVKTDVESVIMAVSYNKPWKLLIDTIISKAELRKMTGISSNTMTKLNRVEEAALAVLSWICEPLKMDVGDIVEYIGAKQRRGKNEKE